jgi:hypothetical protein
MSSHFIDIVQSAKDFLAERLTATLSVSVGAIAVDIVYHLLQKNLRRETLVRFLQQGDCGSRGWRQRQSYGRLAQSPVSSESHTSSLDRHQGSESAIEIDRHDEIKRLSRQMSHRGTITLVIGEIGTGTTSCMRGVARVRPATTYVSLAGARSLEDVCNALQRTFHLDENERRLPTSLFVLVRMLRGLSGVFGSSEEAVGAGEVDQEVYARWATLTGVLECAAAEAVHRSQACAHSCAEYISVPGNPSVCPLAASVCSQDSELDEGFNAVPLIILDNAGELDDNAVNALATFAHSVEVLRVAIVVPHPYTVLSLPNLAHSIKAIRPRLPREQSMVDYVFARCPFLASPSTAASLVSRFCGRNIGLAHLLCVQLEEIKIESPAPLDKIDDTILIDFIYQSGMRAYGFATMRSMHMYSLQPTGNHDLDEQRLGAFRLAICLIDLAHQTTQNPNASASEATAVPFPELNDGLDDVVALRFAAALEVCPLRVMLVLFEVRREALPFFISFDSVRFRAPLFGRILTEVVGAPQTLQRERAERELSALAESLGM